MTRPKIPAEKTMAEKSMAEKSMAEKSLNPFYHPGPIEGEENGIVLLFRYSMIYVYGLNFCILMDWRLNVW